MVSIKTVDVPYGSGAFTCFGKYQVRVLVVSSADREPMLTTSAIVYEDRCKNGDRLFCTRGGSVYVVVPTTSVTTHDSSK